MFRSVNTKIAFSQIGLLLVTILAISGVSYFLLERAIKDQLRQRMAFAASTLARQTAETLAERRNILKHIAAGKEIEIYRVKLNNLMLRQYLQKFRADFPVLTYVNDQGVEEEKMVHGKPWPELRNIADTELFLDAAWTPDRVLVSGVEESPEINEPVLQYIVAGRNYFGDFGGIIVGYVPLRDLVKPVSALQIGETGFASVLDEAGQILSHPKKELIPHQTGGDRETVTKIIVAASAPETALLRANLDGVDGMVVAKPVPGTTWVILVTIPYEEFIAAPKTLQYTTTVLALALLALSTAVVFIVSGSISKPIGRLTQLTEKIAKGGNLKERIDLRSGDEVGRLARSFNNMAEALDATVVSKIYVDNIIKSMTDALVVAGWGGEIKTVNQATLELLGYEKEELIGKPQHAILHHSRPDGTPYPREECPIYAALTDGSMQYMDTEVFWRKDGTSFPAEYSSTPIRESGAIVAAVVTFRNVTERKQAEEKLQARYKELESLHEMGLTILSSQDLKAVLEKVLDQTLLIGSFDMGSIRLSDSGDQLLKPVVTRGYRDPGNVRMHHSDLSKTISKPELAVYKTRVEENVPKCDGLRTLKREGVISAIIVPVCVGKEVIGIIQLGSRTPRRFQPEEVRLLEAVGNQIGIAVQKARLFEETQRRAREQAALNAELTRSNTELEQFSYVASHDLQEPLRKVQTFGERLKAKCSDALGDQGRDYLERMQNAATRMQNLINGLLAYSRVTSKTRPFVPVDLAKVAREVLSDLEVRIDHVGGRVELGELPAIDADPGQMRQLLQNLIGNALKFHREGEAPVVKVHGHPLNGQGSSTGNGSCQIVVEDNGIGFDDKYLDRIFAPFQRLHGRNEYEGTGIGLAICRKVAERHGGTITAKSTPGQGAAFMVTLPLQQMKQPTGEADNGNS